QSQIENLIRECEGREAETDALEITLHSERRAHIEAMDVYGQEWETHQQGREAHWQSQMGLLQARLQSVMDAAAQRNEHQQDELEDLAEEADWCKQELRSIRGVAQESNDSGTEGQEGVRRGAEEQTALGSPAGAHLVLHGNLFAGSMFTAQALSEFALRQQELEQAREHANREQEVEHLWLVPDPRSPEEEESDSEQEVEHMWLAPDPRSPEEEESDSEYDSEGDCEEQY
ncbi:hypothetical protein B484DRAFT_462214, partial [Ochromonadaceae sp. CCMP2298]